MTVNMRCTIKRVAADIQTEMLLPIETFKITTRIIVIIAVLVGPKRSRIPASFRV